MREYKEIRGKNWNYFMKANFFSKFKILLKVLGLRWILYKFFYWFFNLIINNNSSFLKGIIFDLKKKRSEYTIASFKGKEKYILFTNDNVISKEIFIKNEFDFEKLKNSIEFLSSKDFKISNLIDIGANIGAISIPAVKRKLVNKSFAIEPVPENYKILRANIILNDLSEKIETYNCALSEKDDEIVEMEISDNNSGDHRVKKIAKFNIHGEENREIIKVKTKRFDTLFDRLELKDTLVKIDTQGYDAVILSAANKITKKRVPTIIEFWPYVLKRNGSWDKMFEVLRNFRTFADLSKKNITLEEINENNLNSLAQKWEKEKANEVSLFTDLLLL